MKWKLYKESSEDALLNLVDIEAFDKKAEEVAMAQIKPDRYEKISEDDITELMSDEAGVNEMIDGAVNAAEAELRRQLSDPNHTGWGAAWEKDFRFVRGKKRVMFPDILAELVNRGTNPAIKDSDLARLKEWVNQKALENDGYYLPLDKAKFFALRWVRGQAKNCRDTRYAKMFQKDALVAKVQDADDKMECIAEIRKSFPRDISSDMYRNLTDALEQVAAEELLKNHSLDELAKSVCRSHGYINGWGPRSATEYGVHEIIHEILKKEHPEEHKDNSWSTIRGDHWDGCTCGFGYNTDSSD